MAKIPHNIPRLKNPSTYPGSVNKARGELVRDVSKLYLLGLTAEEAKSCKDLQRAVRYVKNTFKSDGWRIPNVERLVDYVYANDIVYDALSPWISYEYLLPLQAFEYAVYLRDESNDLKRIGLFKLASLIFAIILLTRKKNGREVNKFLFKIEQTRDKKVERGEDTSLEESIIELIRRDKKDVLVLTSPSILEAMTGLDVKSIKKYIGKLGLKTYAFRFSIGRDEFRSNRIIIGNNNFEKKFNKFKAKRKRGCSGLLRVQGLYESDIVGEELNSLYLNYELNITRLAYTYFYLTPLNGNRFIRVKKIGGKLIAFSSRKLCDYKFVFNSLYTINGKLKPAVSERLYQISGKEQNFTPLTEKDFAKIKETIMATGVFDEKSYRNRRYKKEKHFKQIREVAPIIDEISNTGIMIDEEKLTDIIEKNKNKVSLVKEGKKILKKLDSAKNEINGTESRVYGRFTTHEASTHRMSCKMHNLQGIHKEISEAFTAPEGWVLLSGDVSGQDVTVAANLAYKLYTEYKVDEAEVGRCEDKPDAKDLNLLNDFETYKSEIKDTVEELSYQKPIDYLTKHLKYLADKPMFTKKELRELTKKFVYTLFYGGSQKTVEASHISSQKIKPYQDELFSEIISSLEDLLIQLKGNSPLSEKLTSKLKRAMNKAVNAKDYDELHKFDTLKKHLKAAATETGEIAHYNEYQHLYLLINYKSFFKERAKTNFVYANPSHIPPIYLEELEKLIKLSYPGILEAFDYYEMFYKCTGNTFPTLLGWSTVADISGNKGKEITKSKSYPIQASGGEFIREWALRLSKERGYRKWFRIVNVIHDQVVVEVKESKEQKMKDVLQKTAFKAAENVGINTSIFSLGEIERIGV